MADQSIGDHRALAENVGGAKYLTLRSTIDHEHRAVLPPPFAPGDVVEIEAEGTDSLVVRRVQRARASELMRLVESSGDLLVVGGPVLSSDGVRRLIEDEA